MVPDCRHQRRSCAWTTEYHGLAVDALRGAGTPASTTRSSPTSGPAHHENVHFYGTHTIDIDGELAKLDTDGYRPLRAPATPTTPWPGDTHAEHGNQREAPALSGAGSSAPYVTPADTARVLATAWRRQSTDEAG